MQNLYATEIAVRDRIATLQAEARRDHPLITATSRSRPTSRGESARAIGA